MDNPDTQFRYPLNSDAVDAVEKGIAILKQCAPFVVVFNQEFSSISIKSSDRTGRFTVTDRHPLEHGKFHQVTVEESENGVLTERKYFLAQGEKASVAIPVESDDNTKCLPVGEIPRLFLGFPVVGTESFSFPAVINSLNFTPTENRDGVYIGQSDNEANIENQAVIEEACDLLVGLLQFAASANWRNTYLLADIPAIRQRDWLNPTWLRECLEERLVEKIRQNPMVLNESGEAVHPDDLELPIADTDDGVVALWDLLDGWEGSHERLPRRDEANGWCAAARSWAILSGGGISSFSEVTDGRKLAEERVEVECGNLEELQSHLRGDISSVDWLNQLYSFLKSDNLDDVLRTCSIVLDQDGWLDVLANLHRDRNIAEELKEIAGLLDWNIQQKLRDTRLVSLVDELGAGDWDNAHVVNEIIKRLQERVDKNPDEDFRQASVRLFTWIVSQGNWELLRGFPVFSERGESDNWSIIKLERVEGDDDRPFAPVGAWPEDLQPFSDIFPRRHTLANAFFEAAPNPEMWQTLEDEGFVRKDVITTTTKEVAFDTFLPDEPLTEGDHETDEYVAITDLAYISRDNIGIMARVRDSQSLARMFWRFLTDWLVAHDASGLEINEATCDCGETHRYYPAEWLIPLTGNRWVPLGGGKRGQVSAQSLADLLRGSGWEPSSLNDNPAAVKLLEAMGITRFDLARAFVPVEERQKQDSILTGILDATAGDTARLSHAHQYIEDLKNDDELPNVLAERRERRRIVDENQSLGRQVENLVKTSLKGAGFTVRRKPIGSDFEIEYDVVEHDEEVGIEVTGNNRTWLVEVKATRDQRVRMTERQAQTAKQEGDRFLLCVVPLGPGVSNPELNTVQAKMRFVENIAPLVTPLCDNLDEFKELREDITADEHSGVQLEVESGAIRVRVASSVWESEGFPIEDLRNRLLNS